MTDGAVRVLITGGSSGIGAAIAREYAKSGARLALFARRKDMLLRVAAECSELGAGSVLTLVGDTTDRDAVTKTAARVETEWGGLDRAFVNAGGYGRKDQLETTRDVAWSSVEFSSDSAEAVMRVNYFGLLYWLEEILPIMHKQRAGTIAFTGAMAADRGHPRHGPYAAAKSAARALFDSMRADAKRYHINLCLIELGCIESEMTEANCCARMPFLQPTDRTARRIVRGVEGEQRVIRFPWRSSVLSRFLASLPRSVFDRWASKQLPPAS